MNLSNCLPTGLSAATGAHHVLAAFALAASLAHAQIPQPTPTTLTNPVSPVSSVADFPDASGRFEKPVNGAQYGGNWGAWTFSHLFTAVPFGSTGPGTMGGSGIVANGASLVRGSSPAPEGTRAAFVQGTGSFHCTVMFQPGIWRLRFHAAQRLTPTGMSTQNVRVTIGGTNVFERVLINSTFEEFLTQPVRITQPTNLKVVFRGTKGQSDKLAMIDHVRLNEVLPWNAPTTWPQQNVPNNLTNVYIPPESGVAMDGPCFAKNVEVQGLLMADDQNGLIRTESILVTNQEAQFRVGTAAEPFGKDFEVTLTGDNPCPTINPPHPACNAKFLMASDGGSIDMHGLPKKSWTHLFSLDSSMNDSVITVDDFTGWQVGDRIVVVTTLGMPAIAPIYDDPKSRECEILDIVGNQIFLNENLNPAEHCTAQAKDYPVTPQTGVPQRTLEQRAEVGMLSRNVRIVGELVTDMAFGGHVMMMGMPNGAHGRGCFSNVEVANMGQEGLLGRYPIHWHMGVENGAGQYIKNCSVHHSFNRAITVHGTHGVTVEDNFCFDQMGHGIFLEDGVETGNVFHHNLVVFTRRPLPNLQVLLSDNEFDKVQNRTPAAFWISHPDNYFTENVAAETIGTGYWFALHHRETGASAKPEWQSTFGGTASMFEPLGSFDRNVAHTCKSGFDVNDSQIDNTLANPIATPDDPSDDRIWTNRSWDPPTQETINEFVVYGCATGIYSGLGTNNKFTDLLKFNECVLADNGGSVQFASGFIIENSLIVHDSGNGILNTQGGNTFNGHSQVVYDGPFHMYECHLVGFDGPGAQGMFYDNFGAARRHTGHQLRGISYEGMQSPRVAFNTYADPFAPNPNPTPAYNNSGVWGVAIVDVDGSLGQGLGKTLITNHLMMHVVNAASQTTADTPLINGVNAWLSPYEFGHLQIFHYNGNQFLTVNKLPGAHFERLPTANWSGAVYDAPEGGPQIRQCPIIVGADTNDSEFTYRVTATNHSNWPNAVNRIDIAVDDRELHDVSMLEIRFKPNPAGPVSTTWAPTVYENNTGSSNPANWNLIQPGGTNQSATSYTSANGVVSLRMVNQGRLHRITLDW